MRRGVSPDTLAVLGAILLAGLTGLLGGCVTRQVAPPVAGWVPSPLIGRPFDVIAAQSRLIVRVYRAGPLAALGHNDVIACRCLAGTIEIVATGEFPLRQTDLGLTPFSALGGGLQVRDGMEVWLRLMARRRRHS